jgi:hypothetical protein
LNPEWSAYQPAEPLAMTCPHCGAQFPLTWRRYASGAFGKHTCPQCETTSQLAWTFSYIAASLMAFVIVGLGLLVAIHFGEKHVWLFLAVWAIGASLWIPADRWFDEKLRELRPIRR